LNYNTDYKVKLSLSYNGQSASAETATITTGSFYSPALSQQQFLNKTYTVSADLNNTGINEDWTYKWSATNGATVRNLTVGDVSVIPAEVTLKDYGDGTTVTFSAVNKYNNSYKIEENISIKSENYPNQAVFDFPKQKMNNITIEDIADSYQKLSGFPKGVESIYDQGGKMVFKCKPDHFISNNASMLNGNMYDDDINSIIINGKTYNPESYEAIRVYPLALDNKIVSDEQITKYTLVYNALDRHGNGSEYVWGINCIKIP
jgi:hypothetical protein